MSDPRIYSCWFEVPQGKAWPWTWYERHARVLAYSARANSPGWSVDVRKIGPALPRTAALGGGNTSSHSYNTHKLIDWVRAVDASVDGDLLLICDADLMILRPLDPVWDAQFDVAYTVKRGRTRLPLNAGVIFLRVNARSRAFFKAWLGMNMKLLGNARLHSEYRKKYAGMNQAALGALLENGGGKLCTLLEIRCEEWNCETATWETYDAKSTPRIVHVKGAMRRALMDPKSGALLTKARNAIADKWNALEKEAVSHG